MTFALEQASTQESFSSIQSHSSLLISANTVLLLWDENKHYRCSKRAVIDQLPYYAITFIITAHDRDTLLKYSKYKQPDYLVFFNLQVTWHLKQQRQKIERLTLCLVTQSCLTPQTVAHQAPLCMGFCRQEYWSRLPISSSSRSSRCRDRTHVSCVSCMADRLFTCWAARASHMKATGVAGLQGHVTVTPPGQEDIFASTCWLCSPFLKSAFFYLTPSSGTKRGDSIVIILKVLKKNSHWSAWAM